MSRKPLTFGPKTRASDALRTLHDGRIRHAPVVDGEELVGIVTDRDLLRALPTTIGELEAAEVWDPPVGEVMTTELVTIGPNDHVEDAARLLVDRRIHGLPVVENGRLVGILTDTDLFGVFVRVFARPADFRLTLVHTPGHELERLLDLARVAVQCQLGVESLVRQDLPGGGVLTDLSCNAKPSGIARFLERIAQVGYTCIESRRDAPTDELVG